MFPKKSMNSCYKHNIPTHPYGGRPGYSLHSTRFPDRPYHSNEDNRASRTQVLNTCVPLQTSIKANENNKILFLSFSYSKGKYVSNHSSLILIYFIILQQKEVRVYFTNRKIFTYYILCSRPY